MVVIVPAIIPERTHTVVSGSIDAVIGIRAAEGYPLPIWGPGGIGVVSRSIGDHHVARFNIPVDDSGCRSRG
jgi:hypothetical protein